MSEVNQMMERYKRIRDWFRNPPNAVPDQGIDLKRTIPPALPEAPIPPPIYIPTPEPPEILALPPPVFFSTSIASSAIELTAEHFNISRSDIISPSRKKKLSRPRQVAMYLAKKSNVKRSLNEIGRYFGGRDHTTILHGVKKVASLMEADVGFRNEVQAIEAKLVARHSLTYATERQHDLAQGSERSHAPQPDISGLDE
jgi:hypothetical protein